MLQISKIKRDLAGVMGKPLIDLLFLTTKIESKGFEKIKPVISSKKLIFAVWHSRILLFSYLYKGIDGVAMVSQSEDGEIVAKILQRQGHKTVRGSAKKGGGLALSRLIKILKEEKKVGLIVPDGPLGPRFKAKLGVIIIAKKTGYPIVPISFSAKRIKVFASWDRFILPFPFTECRAVYGDPVYVPQDAGRDEEKNCLIRLEKELCRITSDADHYFGHRIT